ncbi:glycoside hydrolase family 32 protein [Alteromonas stellipolaris]|uniref:glycoside hydrolase family 32 protein n=1 Tax=Alteromonas stellipolaris TaxID=233316 RepID=UPI003563DDDC
MKYLVSVLISTALVGCSMQSSVVNRTTDTTGLAPMYNEKFRPQAHFTPPEKWMNDPNGMFYLDGEYHLFYQHNPNASVWGPMHWGHAVSRDLVHWEHLPIALYPDEQGTIFSGSAVVDWNNSSGLGTKENPPIVALYTYHNPELEKAGRIDFQTQAMAYSLDKGRTWQKYAQNPVVENPGIRDFRDPKVMWHEGSKQWIMALAQKDHIGFYSSENLKEWKLESTFGENMGSHGGVWECPELILMPIAGTDEYRYVLLVSIMPGGPNGGSATQYFVGDFDGKNFVLDDTWQQALAQTPAEFPEGTVFADFEQEINDWHTKGDAFNGGPTAGSHGAQPMPEGFEGQHLINSFKDGDLSTGSLTSPKFLIEKPFINFKLAGGQHTEKVGVNLLVDNKVVMSATGKNRNILRNVSWDVAAYEGQHAQLQIIDYETGGWGHVLVDQFVFSDHPARNQIEPAVWLDYGTDNYAGVTFFKAPNSDEQRHVFMGWMSNWLYANEVPSSNFRSAMTLPRELILVNSNHGLRVKSKLAKEVYKLKQQETSLKTLTAGDSLIVKEADGKRSNTASIFSFNIDTKSNPISSITLANDEGESIGLVIDTKSNVVKLDRSLSGKTDFHSEFGSTQHALLNYEGDEISVTVVADRGSVEVFIDDGLTVMTALVFPKSVYTTLKTNDDTTEIHSVLGARLASIYAKK